MNLKDALILEEYEQELNKNNRTRRAIYDTYGEKSDTKKRHKLSGKRKWKNKRDNYAVLEGQMKVREFNKKSKAMKVLNEHFGDKGINQI